MSPRMSTRNVWGIQLGLLSRAIDNLHFAAATRRFAWRWWQNRPAVLNVHDLTAERAFYERLTFQVIHPVRTTWTVG